MPTLQIRFVSGKGWDSKLIEWYSRCRWSHVEMLFPVGYEIFGATLTQSRTFGAQFKRGLRWRSTTDPCYSKAVMYEIWEIPISDQQKALLEQLLSDASGAPYDWMAILSFVLGQHRIHITGAWICSGYLAGIIESLNLLKTMFDPQNYSPRDIYMLVPNISGARKVL